MYATNYFIRAFQESAVTSSLQNSDEFDEYSSRLLRYAMYAASYENTSYRNIHTWAQGVRQKYGLGKYIADVYNPTAQLVDFHTSTIWRGNLAPGLIGGAIPLVVSGKSDEERVRYAASELLRVSNFEIAKNIAVMWGCNLGDVGLRVVDDKERGQVRIEVIDPSEIEDIRVDNGIIKGYVLTRVAEADGSEVQRRYTETCERGDNDDVIFRTYIDGNPAAFPGAEYQEWVETYGFVPFATIQHRNVGGLWGWAEAHPIRPKIMTMDDQATLLNDWIRRATSSVGLISGMDAPTSGKITTTTSAATADNPQPGREENKFLWGGKDSTVEYIPLVAPLDIAAVTANIQNIMASIESDMPELRKSIWDISGDASGVALATAREPVEAKITNRRTNYDNPLVHCMQMGIAIGGMRGYPGHDGFDLQSYERGQLDMSIAPRPVFPEQRYETRNAKTSFWQTWAAVANSGVAFDVYARDYGWSDEQIAAYLKSQQDSYIPVEGL